MKSLKTKIMGLLIVAIIFSAGILKAENNEPDTYSDLKYQIQKEMIGEFREYVSVKYENRDLKGDAVVTLTVEKNGKICLKEIVGENKLLNQMIKEKVSETNMWTDTKFGGRTFQYTVVSK
jgi:hypothetical protein